jgi:hypothetical protein
MLGSVKITLYLIYSYKAWSLLDFINPIIRLDSKRLQGSQHISFLSLCAMIKTTEIWQYALYFLIVLYNCQIILHVWL